MINHLISFEVATYFLCCFPCNVPAYVYVFKAFIVYLVEKHFLFLSAPLIFIYLFVSKYWNGHTIEFIWIHWVIKSSNNSFSNYHKFSFIVYIWQGNRLGNLLSPELVTSLKQVNERVVQISLTNSIFWNAHTFAVTESGKLYAFGAGDKGQLGIELDSNQIVRGNPEQVDIDLN